MSTQAGKAYIGIEFDPRDMSRLDSDARSAGKKAAAATSRFSKLGGAVKSVGKAALFASIPIAGALVYTMGKSVQAAIEAQNANIRLRGAFKKAGISGKELAGVHQALTDKMFQTAIADERLSDGLAKFVQSTGDLNQAYYALSVTTDLAAARNVEFEQAQKAVEKALNGSVGGLSRMGVKLDDNATKTEVLDTLQKRFGGSAKKQASGAEGAWKKLGLAWDEIQESLGTGLLPLIQDTAKWLQRNSDKFAEARRRAEQFGKDAAKWIRKEGIPAVKDIAHAIEVTADKIESLVSTTERWVDKLQEAAAWAENIIPGQTRLEHDVTQLINASNVGRNSGGGPAGGHGGHRQRARGGPVSAGTSYLVGERGPEMFTPRVSGHIIPNSALGGGMGLNITVLLDGQRISDRVYAAIERSDRELIGALGAGA